jgi:pimeloyl-ACP methyl ester carboxylesterase
MDSALLGPSSAGTISRMITEYEWESAEWAASVELAEAMERFEAEASHGTCATGRYRCNYSVWGKGPALVFVHGLADLPRSFVLPMALLSGHFRCIGYALPDGGRDGADLKHYKHADLVADLFALLDHLGIERTYLFGSSFGSTIVLAAMHSQPARIPRAILQGGFARRPLRLGERMLVGAARCFPGRMRHVPFRRLLITHRQHAPVAARAADVWEYLLACTGAPSINAFARRALMMHHIDLRHILPQIRRPVLVVCGQHDPLVSTDREAELLQGLPLARRVEIANCGHFPYYSHPEALSAIVQDFLTPPARKPVNRLQQQALWPQTASA